MRAVLPELKTEYNKFDRGRLLLIAGSYGMAGAAILASKAALRAGVGYLNLAVPKEIYEIVAKVLPEAVFTIYEKPEELIPAIEKANCVAVGPGLSGMADRILPVVTAHVNCPLLLDADGLNALSRMTAEKGVPRILSGKLFMTPHEGEMARLLGVTSDEVRSDKEGALRRCIEKYHATVLLKGAGTLISDPEKIETEDPFFVNSTGNPGMAVAGSGDVLTGIAGSLIA